MLTNTRAIARKYGAKVATAALVSCTSLAALAADDIDTKITDSGVKMVAYATAVVGIMVGFWAVKRAGQKMGWW